MSTLSENIKNKRKQLNLTQENIAVKLNINRATDAGYETGKSSPDIETLIKLADLFETSIDFLVGRYTR